MFGDALRRGHTRRYLVVAIAIVIAAAAVLAGQALADSGSTDSSLRTALVKRASVSQTLQRSGTIEPVAQGTVAFPIAGTISTVAVQAGQTVTTGQTLATLDATALQAAVAAKQASLAAAQLTLNNALSGISSAPTGNGGSRSTTTTTARASTASSPGFTQARRAVTSGQQQVDSALSTATVALANASSACADTHPSTSTTTSPTSSSTTSTTPTTTASPSPSPSSNPPSACLQALQRSLSAQQQVAAAEAALAQAQRDLDDLLNAASTSTNSSDATSNRTESSPSSSGPSSAELVADQAAVDAARADLTAAEQNLAQASVVSPIDATVAAVNMTPGEQVSAGSSTANIVVVGAGGYEVTTTVNVTDIGKVKLGDAATVLPDGSASPLDGKVVSIGVMPTTSGNTTVYPVVIGLTGPPSSDLHNGASASVTIVLTQATDALTVPTSAVRSAAGGGLQLVTVLSSGKSTTVPVQGGAVGAELTEIRSGLQEGQTVVVADLNEPVPSNNTTTNGRGGFDGAGGGNGTFIQRG